ncbi:MAG: dipeptidase [Oscillospiraceae bacterium]|jgi:membrane dipeptidase|nr:dipeptidase [Oscillospiraceae bacterium]
MNFFDLHCDTIYECFTKKKELKQNNFCVSIENGKYFNKWVQCFAIWLNDTKLPDESFNFALNSIDFWNKELKKNNNVVFCKKKSDIESITSGNIGAILTIEGMSFLSRNPSLNFSILKKLYKSGVRLMTLTWNGSGEVFDGVLSSNQRGLTVLGKCVINNILDLGILIDLSHANDFLFYDVIEYTKGRKVLVTHSNSRKVCNNVRNLTDQQFLLIKSFESLVGVTFHKNFLSSENRKNANLNDVLRHVEHFLELGGEKNISIGSDFDGSSLPEDITSILSIEKIYEAFLKRYSESLVNDIFFNNAYRFFLKNIQ